MFGNLALAAVLIAAALGLYRLAAGGPDVLRTAQVALALAAGALGIAWWRGTGDSRWLVGGVLAIGAGVPGYVAGARRGVAIAALILLLMGLGLYGVATVRPMLGPIVLTPAAT